MPDETKEQPVLIPGQDNEGNDHLVAYCNSVAIAHTLFDFQLNFIESLVQGDQQVKSDLFATVLMSPQHAKLFYKSLERNVQMYEEVFGEIQIPEAAYQAIIKPLQVAPPQAT
jgi:hypothetical protein